MRAYSVSAILKGIEALKMKTVTYLLLLFFSSTTVLSDSHDASSTVRKACNSAAKCARHDCIRVLLGLSIGSMVPDISTYLSAEDPI